LKNLHAEDIRKESVCVPQRGNIADPAKRFSAYVKGREWYTCEVRDTEENQSRAGNEYPTVNISTKRKKPPRGNLLVEREPWMCGGYVWRVMAVLRPDIRALAVYFSNVTRYKKCKGNIAANEEWTT